MQNIFITGINGFIGTHCVRAFLKKRYVVSGIGQDGTSALAGVEYRQCDVRDLKCVKEASRGKDIFIHLAGITEHHAIVNDPIETLGTNWDGTKSALDSFIENKGKHFVFTSTGKVYGEYSEKDLPLTEETPPRPLSILGKSKYICERLIDYYARIYPDRIFTILRVFNVYGSEQKGTFLIPTMMAQIQKGANALELKDVEAKRDYIYIDDVVDAIGTVIEKRVGIGVAVYNIGTGVPSSARDIADIFSKILRKKIEAKGDPLKKRNDELPIEFCVNEKLKAFGWKPQFNLNDGLSLLTQICKDL